MILKIIFLQILCLFCLPIFSQSANKDTACTENSKFKKNYFRCIKNVESYVLNVKDKKNLYVSENVFMQSLKSLSKFGGVNWSLLENYSQNYSYSDFVKQKNGWLIWYNANKCKNLKWL